MAGRPLRRLRSNPLVEFDRQYSGTMGSADYYYGPMLHANAEERFRAGMAVCDEVLMKKGIRPLRLNFMVRPAMQFGSAEEIAVQKEASAIALKDRAITLIEYVYARTTQRGSKPGDPSRETPHTLFNALHRLSEFVMNPPEMKAKMLYGSSIWPGDLFGLPCLSPGRYYNYRLASDLMQDTATLLAQRMNTRDQVSMMQCFRALLSSGLNTAAGRLGAIDDTDQAVAEAFAKYCLSMDMVYDPNAPLMMEGKVVTLDPEVAHEVQVARDIWSAILEQTACSLVLILSLFCRSYYTKLLPSKEDRFLDHYDTRAPSLNWILPKRYPRFKDLSWNSDTDHADVLYREVEKTWPQRPSREERDFARKALHDVLSSADHEALRTFRRTVRGGEKAEREFLRNRFSKPRNTAASQMKAKRIMSALDVLDAYDFQPPGLHATFIQPNE